METGPISCSFSLDSFFPITTSHYTMRISFFVQKEELKDNLALHVRVEQREEICQYRTSDFFCIIFLATENKQTLLPKAFLRSYEREAETPFCFSCFFAFLNVTERRRLTGYLRKDSKLVKETCKAWERSARCRGSGLAPTSTAASTVVSRRRYETMSRNPDPHHTAPNQKKRKPPHLQNEAPRDHSTSCHHLPR